MSDASSSAGPGMSDASSSADPGTSDASSSADTGTSDASSSADPGMSDGPSSVDPGESAASSSAGPGTSDTDTPPMSTDINSPDFGLKPTPDMSVDKSPGAGPAAPDPANTGTPDTPYHGDYPWSSPTVDSATNAAWDVAGMIPGVGTVTNAAGFAIDAGKAGIDAAMGDMDSAAGHWGNATQDAVGMIPGVGTYLGYANLTADLGSTAARGSGVPAAKAPNSSDIWNQNIQPAINKGITAPAEQEDPPYYDF
jgi:hypothetical protein